MSANDNNEESNVPVVSSANIDPASVVDNQGAIQKPTEIDETHGHGGSGVLGTAFNMSCNIMGGGLLTFPLMMKHCSSVVGVILIILFGFIAFSTALMISVASDHLQCYSYRSLAIRVVEILGKPNASRKVGITVDVCLMIYTFGLILGYCRIVNDSMPDVVIYLFKGDENKFYTKEWFWALVSCLFVFFPLTSLPTFSHLKFSSFFGLLTILYAIFLVTVHFFIGDYDKDVGSLVASDVKVLDIRFSLFQGIGLIALAFNCHYNIPFYYKELKDHSPKRYRHVSMILFSSITVFYIAIGLFGYLMLGDKRTKDTKGNVMNGFYKDALDANIGRLLLFVHFLTTFPVVAFCCRNCINQIIFKTVTRPWWQYIIEAFILVLLSGMLGYFVPGLKYPFGIIGVIFGVPDVLLVPSFSFIAAYRDYQKKMRDGQVGDCYEMIASDKALEAKISENVNTIGNGTEGIERAADKESDESGKTNSDVNKNDENNAVTEGGVNNIETHIESPTKLLTPASPSSELITRNIYGSKEFETNPKFYKFFYHLALFYLPFCLVLLIICLVATIYGFATG